LTFKVTEKVLTDDETICVVKLCSRNGRTLVTVCTN